MIEVSYCTKNFKFDAIEVADRWTGDFSACSRSFTVAADQQVRVSLKVSLTCLHYGCFDFHYRKEDNECKMHHRRYQNMLAIETLLISHAEIVYHLHLLEKCLLSFPDVT